MTLNPRVMEAVERLNYRVTVGDVAAQAGLEVHQAQQALLALASQAGGHLQVAESGDIAYLFPANFKAVLRNKFLRLRLQEWWNKIWRVLFYLIRISFGILLIVSILIIVAAIIVIVIALNSSRGDNDSDNNSSGGGSLFLPNFWIGSDWFWFFNPNPYGSDYASHESRRTSDEKPMNFLEAVFSFLFGDGNPNANLDVRRWRSLATVIRNHQGAVAAEQLVPYLEIPASASSVDDYVLPVLTRFEGRPEVSPEGEIIYHFPELQTTTTRSTPQRVADYLRELPWRFSRASTGQMILAIGLGAVNLVGALVLGSLLADGAIAAELGGFIAFVQSIFGLLLGYGIGFLAIPLIRYFWVQWRNRQIEVRNQQRQARAALLNHADPRLQRKLTFARQFAAETVVSADNLAYTTEKDLLEQETEQSAAIDAEWQRRLDQPDS